MASPSGPHTSSPYPGNRIGPGFWGLAFPTPAKNGVGLVRQEPQHWFCPSWPPEEKRGVLLVLLSGQAAKRACSSGDDSLLEGGTGAVVLERDCPWLPSSPPAPNPSTG